MSLTVTDSPTSAPFSMASLSLARLPGADCTAFLERVSKELGYSGKLPDPPRAAAVSGSLAIFSVGQSRSEGADGFAAYSSNPPGGWMTGKLFLVEGEGEVFLDMSERDGVAAFSIKDADYASIVVNELASVLLPDGGR